MDKQILHDQRIADFKQHITNLLARTKPILSTPAAFNNGHDQHRSPNDSEWLDFRRRLEIAQNIYGMQATQILLNAAAVNVATAWPDLVENYLNSTHGGQYYDPGRISEKTWNEATKVADNFVKNQLNLSQPADPLAWLKERVR